MLFDANASARSVGVGTNRVTREVLEDTLTYTRPKPDAMLSIMEKRVKAAARDVEDALYWDPAPYAINRIDKGIMLMQMASEGYITKHEAMERIPFD